MAKDRYDQPKQDEPKAAHLEGTEMPDHLRGVQQAAAQPHPAPVKLVPAKDDAGHPDDAPPVPPKASPEPVPRLIDQSERSPDPGKLSRFKVRATAPFDSQPYLYVLAPKGDKKAAVECYKQTSGLQAVLDTFPEGQRPTPLVTCKELPD